MSVRLNHVLTYKNDAVVRRYMKDYGSSRVEADELFREMLKWFYLGYRYRRLRPSGFRCAMYPEMARIDAMWHTFILFTRAYAEFGRVYFGKFIHHTPSDEEKADIDPVSATAELEAFFGFIYDELGADTLQAWFGEMRYASREPVQNVAA
jgi:hypothetical protein